MQHFVSAQVYALRNHSVRSGRPSDHWGFAWSPRNSSSLPADDWAAMTGAVLDRLATAIRDSATETPADPGVRACGPSGRNLWCAGDLDGAATHRQLARVPRVVADDARVRLDAAVGGRRRGVGRRFTVQAQVAGVPARPAAPVVATFPRRRRPGRSRRARQARSPRR